MQLNILPALVSILALQQVFSSKVPLTPKSSPSNSSPKEVVIQQSQLQTSSNLGVEKILKTTIASLSAALAIKWLYKIAQNIYLKATTSIFPDDPNKAFHEHYRIGEKLITNQNSTIKYTPLRQLLLNNDCIICRTDDEKMVFKILMPEAKKMLYKELPQKAKTIPVNKDSVLDENRKIILERFEQLYKSDAIKPPYVKYEWLNTYEKYKWLNAVVLHIEDNIKNFYDEIFDYLPKFALFAKQSKSQEDINIVKKNINNLYDAYLNYIKEKVEKIISIINKPDFCITKSESDEINGILKSGDIRFKTFYKKIYPKEVEKADIKSLLKKENGLIGNLSLRQQDILEEVEEEDIKKLLDSDLANIKNLSKTEVDTFKEDKSTLVDFLKTTGISQEDTWIKEIYSLLAGATDNDTL